MLHRRLPRLELPGHTYFLTCCVDNRRSLLLRAGAAELLLKLYGEARERGDIALHAYVVMPDHYHVVVTLVGESSVSNLVRKVHGLFAWRWYRRTGNPAGHEGPALPNGAYPAGHEGLGGQPPIRPAVPRRRRRRLWQRRFYDHVVRDEEDWRTRMTYLHDNPVRAGLVTTPTDYAWSSAQFWDTGRGPVRCESMNW